MRLTCFLIAEHASVSREGKLTIAGTIDDFQIQRLPGESASPFPIAMPPAYLVSQVEFNFSEGLTHAGRLRVLDDDGEAIAPEINLPGIQLTMNAYGRPMRHNMIMRINGLRIPRPGDYVFELSIDGTRVGETPLYVTDITPPNR